MQTVARSGDRPQRRVMKKGEARITKQHTRLTNRRAARLLHQPYQVNDGQLVKALILHGLAAFEESFRRIYPEASLEEIRAYMTQYLNERTRFEYTHPRRSFRFGRHN